MGSLEDQYGGLERSKVEQRRQDYCALVRQLTPLLQPAVTYFETNPQHPNLVSWLLYDGELRVAWPTGFYLLGPDSTGDTYLLPEGVLVMTEYGRGTQERPMQPSPHLCNYHIVDLTLSPSDQLVAQQYGPIEAVLRELKRRLSPAAPPPQSAPAPRRSWTGRLRRD